MSDELRELRNRLQAEMYDAATLRRLVDEIGKLAEQYVASVDHAPMAMVWIRDKARSALENMKGGK